MILRLNQIDRTAAEPLAGWDQVLTLSPAEDGAPDPRSAVEYAWPADTFAYELHGLETARHDLSRHDLSGYDLSGHDLSAHDDPVEDQPLRRLLPPLLAALLPEGSHLVLRLDGPFAPGELLALMPHLCDTGRVHRFALSMLEKLWTGQPPLLASARLWPTAAGVAGLCDDLAVGLAAGVRLRAFAVPDAMINPLLDTTDRSDERWREILPRCAFVLSTGVALTRLVLWTRQFSPAQMTRLVQSVGVAS